MFKKTAWNFYKLVTNKR